MAFFNLFAKKPAAKVAHTDQMPATVTEAGVLVGARPLVNNSISGGYTPERISGILERAQAGDEHSVQEAFKLFDYVFEREMHCAGVANGLALAVAGLPHRSAPPKGDTSRKAQKYADEVATLIGPSSALGLAKVGLIFSGISHSIGAASIEWDTTGAVWKPASIVQKPSHFFTYSRQDGRTPLLRNTVAGQPAQPIVPGTALVFTPRKYSALQIKNSLGWVLCWAYVIKSVVLANQQVFIETFGQPMVFGQYRYGATNEDISALRSAVTALSGTFRAVMRDDLNIKFQEVARSSTDIYEKLCRYLDECISKVVWASTLTTDAGGSGSYALGKVHAEGKYDVIRAYAQQWAACLQEFTDLYMTWNYGPEAPKPVITVDVEEAEDLKAESEIIKNLHDAGVPLVANEIREKFGFREPQEGDEIIAGATSTVSTPAPEVSQGTGKAKNRAFERFSGQGASTGCPVHSLNSLEAPPRDSIDDLADALLPDWQAVSTGIDEMLLAATSQTNGLEELRTALENAVSGADLSGLTALLTKAKLKARLAGELKLGL